MTIMMFNRFARALRTSPNDLDGLKRQAFRRRGFGRDARVEPLERRTLLSVSDLDPTFGSHGRVLTDLAGSREAPAAVAVQSDGKILVAGVALGSGYGNTDGILLRYTASGALDSAFGAGGIVRVALGRSERFTDLAIQSDGKIVVGGTRHENGYVLARYTSGGALDPTFAGDGMVIGAGPLTQL